MIISKFDYYKQLDFSKEFANDIIALFVVKNRMSVEKSISTVPFL